MRLLLTFVALVGSASLGSAAGKFPKPMSYAKPVGAEFLFVQLGDPREESEHGTTSQKAQFAELRATYPAPGLYRKGEPPVLVWGLPAGEFVPYDLAFLTPDGRHLVRVEGEFWQTESFPGGTRPTAAAQQRQLAGAALSFLTDGKPVKSYTLREFVGDVEVYKHTPEHLIWYASAVLNAETGKFILYTQEATRFTFDMRTGESLEVSKVGLSNPIVEKILIVMAGMTVLILAGWGLFVMRRRQPDSVRLAP